MLTKGQAVFYEEEIFFVQVPKYFFKSIKNTEVNTNLLLCFMLAFSRKSKQMVKSSACNCIENAYNGKLAEMQSQFKHTLIQWLFAWDIT